MNALLASTSYFASYDSMGNDVTGTVLMVAAAFIAGTVFGMWWMSWRKR